MQKIIIFMISIMIISFFTPYLFLLDVVNFKSNIITKLDLPQIKEKDESFISNEKIKLLLTESGEVVELDFDEYIKGVLIGEVPITYEIEALKAQAIVARTYTLYKLENNQNLHENADMCDDINCCQAYKTKEYALACWDDIEEKEKWQKFGKIFPFGNFYA